MKGTAMSIYFRQLIQKYQKITTAGTITVILLALVFIVTQIKGMSSPGERALYAYFSADDGATWFADDITKVPPFTKDGKEVVRAYVFRCGGGKPFIGYLMRFTPEAKKSIDTAMAKGATSGSMPPDLNKMMTEIMPFGGEVKKPSSGKWALATRDPEAYSEVMKFGCPGGNMKDLEMVLP
jgi:hypothetical protein